MPILFRKRVAIAGVAVAVILILAVLISRAARSPPLTLTFVRYSTESDRQLEEAELRRMTNLPGVGKLYARRLADGRDWFIGSVAFLSLSNRSGRPYHLALRTNTNRVLILGDWSTESYVVNCAFRDQTSRGWTNWAQEPPRFSRRGGATGTMDLVLRPNSAVILRVPLDPGGRKPCSAGISPTFLILRCPSLLGSECAVVCGGKGFPFPWVSCTGFGTTVNYLFQPIRPLAR